MNENVQTEKQIATKTEIFDIFQKYLNLSDAEYNKMYDEVMEMLLRLTEEGFSDEALEYWKLADTQLYATIYNNPIKYSNQNLILVI